MYIEEGNTIYQTDYFKEKSVKYTVGKPCLSVQHTYSQGIQHIWGFTLTNSEGKVKMEYDFQGYSSVPEDDYEVV